MNLNKLSSLVALVAGSLRPNLASVRADAPPAVVELMRRCWAAEPRERPAIAEVARALEAVRSHISHVAMKPPGQPGR